MRGPLISLHGNADCQLSWCIGAGRVRGVLAKKWPRLEAIIYCSDCNVSFPYPSKLKRHLETRKHQLLEAIEDAARHNAHEQMELDTNSDAGEQKSDFHCENVEQLAWSDVSY